MAKAIYASDTKKKKNSPTEWAESTKDGVARGVRIYGDVRVSDEDTRDKRGFKNYAKEAGARTPALGVSAQNRTSIPGRNRSSFSQFSQFSSAKDFNDYARMRREMEEAEGVRSAADKLAAMYSADHNMKSREQELKDQLLYSMSGIGGSDRVAGLKAYKDISKQQAVEKEQNAQLLYSMSGIGGSDRVAGLQAYKDIREQQRRKELQEASEALMQNYGYKKIGNEAVFVTPFSPLPKKTAENTATRAKAPGLFDIKPEEYLENMGAIDSWNNRVPEAADPDAKAFLDKYFGGRIPTDDEFNDKYDEIYNDPSIPDEDVRYFYWDGAELVGKEMGRQSREQEARVGYDAALEALGADAAQYAGKTDAEYLSRYAPKVYGREGQKADSLYPALENGPLQVTQEQMESWYANPLSHTTPDEQYSLMRWGVMTPEERENYTAIAQNSGAGIAQEYLKALEPELNKRVSAEKSRDAAAFAQEHPFLASMAATIERMSGAASYGMMSLEELLTGRTPDEYDLSRLGTRTADSVVGAVGEKIQQDVEGIWGKALGFGYQTMMSLADMGANMLVYGPAGAVASSGAMGLSAAASAYNDAIDRGADHQTANAMAAVSGIAEMLFEKFSIESLIGIAKGNGLGKAVLNVMRQMGIEASEEMGTEIANLIGDTILMGDMSVLEQAGPAEMAKQIGLAGLGGALMGGVTGGIAQGVNSWMNRGNQQQTETAQQETPAEEPQTPAEDAQQPEPTPEEPKTPVPDVRDALIREYTPTAAQEAQGEAETAMDEQEEAKKEKPAEGASTGKNGEAFGEARSARVTDEEGNTSAVTVLGVKSVSDSGLITLEVENENGERDTINAADAEFDDDNTNELMAYAASGRMDAKAMRGYLDGYDENIATAEEYAEAYTSVYSRARGGVDFEQAALGNAQARQYLTRDAMIDAYAAGQNAYNQVHDTGSAEIVNEGSHTGAEDVRYSIKEEGGRRFVEVDTDQNFFDGVSGNEALQKAREYIISHFKNQFIGEGAAKSHVTRATANEYSHPAARNNMAEETKTAKAKASAELDNLLSVSTFVEHVDDDGRHKEAVNGWDHYKTIFRVGRRTFEARVNILKGNGYQRLYDITQIKNVDGVYGLSGKNQNAISSIDNNSISKKRSKGKGKISKRYTEKAFEALGSEGKKKALAQMELLSALATRTGRTIAIVDEIVNDKGEHANALYDRKTGEIRVALDADENAYAYAAVHELVHAMKNEHSSQWKEFRDFVFEALRESGSDVEKLIAYQMERFGYSRELAEEEVVCNTVPAILGDERNVLKLYKGSRALFERVVDWVKDLLSDIQKAGEVLSQRSRSWAQMDALKNDREKMQKIYDEMMRILAEEGEASGKEQTVFSMKETVEETRDLLAVHNLTEENMRNAMELGGLAMPSIAVIKAEQGHSQYGTISVIFDKSTIDPKASSANEIYGGDAWTPTFPQVEYEADSKAEERIRDKYYELEPKVGNQTARAMYRYATGLEDEMNRNGGVSEIIKKLEGDTDMMQLYLADNGLDRPEPVKKTIVKRTHKHQAQQYDSFIQKMGEDVVRSFETPEGEKVGDHRRAWMDEHYEALKQAYVEVMADATGLPEENVAVLADNKQNVRRMLLDAYHYMKTGGETREEVTDYEATEKAIRDAVDEAAYKKWLNDLFEGAEKSKGIRNQTGMYTPSGKRRSFSATHWDVTLDNVMRAMRSEEKTGVGSMGGRNIEGAAVKKYRSIKDVKADSSRLQTIDQDEYDALRKGFRDRFSEIAREYAGDGDWFDAGDVLVEAVTKYQTADGIYKYISKYTDWYKPSKKIADDLYALVEEMKNAPTGYFEAKPRRAVGFGEMAAVIVPDDISNDVRDSLEKAGVNLIEYKAGNEADRLEKMNSEDVDILRFSMRDTDENVQSALAAEESAIAQVKAHRINAMEADKIAGQMLKLANSDYDRQELASRISRTISYMETGEDVDMQQVDDEMTAITADVMNHSRTLDLEHEERMKPIRDYLRTTKIRLTDKQRAEAANLSGSYGAFRKSLFGRARLVSVGGIALDTAWQELNAIDSGLFPGNVREGDMPVLLQAAIDEAKPVYHNGMGMNADESANWLAGKMMEAYFALPAVKAAAKDAKTFGDSIRELKKAMSQFEDVSWSEYQNALQSIKQARTNEERTQKQQEAAALRKKYQQWRAKDTAERKERELKNRYRAKIERTTMTLSNWLLKPTDAKHVPAGLEDSIRRMLETLDFSGKDTKTAAMLSERLASLASALENAQEGEDETRTVFLERDQQMIDEIRRVAELIRGNTSYQQMEGRGIYDLNSKELKELSKWLDVIRHNVVEASKLRGSDLPYTSVDEAASLSMMEMGRKKAWKDKKWITKTWMEAFGPDMQDSFTFFERLGPTANQIFRGLREGFDKVTRLTRQAETHTKEILKDVNLRELTGRRAKKISFELASGEKLELTKAQIMELYVLEKREQARGHLYGDGIVLQGDDDRRAKQLKPTDVKRIVSALSAEEKKVADGLQSFVSRECASWGNEASVKLVGYRKFGEQYYWPIRTDSNTRNTTKLDESYAADINAIRNQGMTKQTVEGAKNAIVIGDIFDTYTRHISNMAAYAGYALPLSDFTRWYNSRGVKTEIEQMMGRKGLNYINNFLMAVNGSGLREEQSGIAKAAGVLSRNAKIASVGANVRVVVQQPTSYARAAMYMSPKYLSMGLTMKAPDADLVNRYCGIAQWKRWGFYETNIGPNLRQMIVGDETAADKMRELATKPAAAGDNWTLNHLWNACVAETKAEYGYKEGSEAFYTKVGKRLSEIIDRTQVVDSVFHRSQMMRSKNAMNQMMTNFMSEPTKTYNMLMSAISDYADNRKNKAARNRVVRGIVVYAATGIMTAAAAAIVDAFRDDDAEKEWLEKYLDAIGNNAIDNLNPLGLLPGVKDVLSLLQGYEPSRLDQQSIQRIIWAVDEVKKYAEGTSKQNLYGVTYKIMQAVSSLVGIPVSNLMRDGNAIAQTITGVTPTLTAEARGNQTISHLFNALMKGEKERGKKLREELRIKAGMTPKEIDTELAEKLMGVELIKTAWEAKTAKNYGDMNRAKNALTAKGFNSETVDKAITRYGSSVTPKTPKVKDPAEQLMVTLYSEEEVVSAARILAGVETGGSVTEADVRSMISERIAGSEAKNPDDSVKSGIQSALKKDYLAMEAKGDVAGMNKLGMVMKNLLGTKDEDMEQWVKDQHSANLRTAVDSYDSAAATKAVQAMRKDGKTDSQIKSSLQKYKQLYIDAMNRKDTIAANKIKRLLIGLGLKGKNGDPLYDEETFIEWMKK